MKLMHIDENKIESLVFSPDLLEENEKVEIHAHLEECGLCNEKYNEIHNLYKDIITEIGNSPTSGDKEFGAKIYSRLNEDKSRSLSIRKKLLTQTGLDSSNGVEIYNGRTQIIERRKIFSLQSILFFIKNYPVTSGGFVLAGAIALGFIITTFKGTIKDDNPVYAETKSGILEVFNREGDLLWKKTVGNLPDRKFEEPISEENRDIKKYFSIMDIDNDNKNEVLISGTNNNTLYTSDSLYCFENNGKLRWTTSVGNFPDFGTERWQHTNWNIKDFFTTSSIKSKNLIIIAHDDTYAPMIISRLNPENGNIISSYYHCGWNFAKPAQKLDIDNDGNEEIIIGLTNNALRRAALLVLSPDNLKGMAPANSYFYPAQYSKGSELYYIVFPITNYGQKFAKAYSFVVYEISIGSDKITINTTETPGNAGMGGSILYSLTRDMRVVNAIGSQEFNRNYDELYKQGVFEQPRDLNYFKSLVDSVQYWDGDKFVNFHTKNKYLSKNLALP